MNHHVGVAVVLYDKYGRVLLEERSKEPGAGNLVLVGGTLDEPDPHFGIAREVEEEIGLILAPHNFIRVWFAHSDKPFLMLYFAMQIVPGREENREPEKCKALHWVDINKLGKVEHRMWMNDVHAIYAANRLLGITVAANQQRIFEGL